MFSREKHGTVDVVTGTDAILDERLEQAAGVLASCLGHGRPQAVLALRDVPLIDSAGLELLLDTQDEFLRQGGLLKLAELTPLCKEILSVTGVADRFEVYPDVKSAVGSFVR